MRLRCIFLNANVLVGFDVLAGADGAAGPYNFNFFDNRIVVYTEDGGEFAL